MISTILLGGSNPCVGSTPASVMVTGCMKLTRTATTAAQSVLNRYRKITVRNCFIFPPLALASDDETRIKTKIGAIAFRAPTNN